MKKVAILSLHLGFGGIEKSIVVVSNLLCEKYDVEIICTYKLYDKPVFDIDERVKIRYLLPNLKPNREEIRNCLKNFKIFSLFKESFKAIKILYLRKKTMVNYIANSDADIIISTRDIFNEWLSEYAPKGILKIGWEHNHYHDNYNYARSIVRSAMRLDYLVLVSDSLRKYYKKQMVRSNCKCVYIPNIVDEIPKNCSKLNEKRIVSIGRLSPEKGYLDLLRIYNSVVHKYPDWKLDIIGDGVEKAKLEEYINHHNLNNSVTLHGFRKKEYINDVLHKSSIYVMTSYTESFGIVLLEAMSHGLPCIAFDSAEGACELINSGMNGYLIKHRNFSAMIKKIEDLIKDIEVRKRIGKAGRADVKKYTSEVVKDKWFDLLER